MGSSDRFGKRQIRYPVLTHKKRAGRTGPVRGNDAGRGAGSVAPEGFVGLGPGVVGVKADVLQDVPVQPRQGLSGAAAVVPAGDGHGQRDQCARHRRQLRGQGEGGGPGRHGLSPEFVLIQCDHSRR